MADNISTKQNLSDNIDCLAAQRALYSKAKTISNAQIFLGIPVTVGISIVALIWADPALAQEYHFQPADISWFVAFLSVIVSLFEFLVFSPWADQTKEEAAKIQEMFDCAVLDLPWNELVAGGKPDSESVNKHAKAINLNPKEKSRLINWYPVKLDDLPKHVSRLICQRTNLRWDSELRKEFSFWSILAAVVLFLFLLGLGIYGDLTIRKFFLLVLAPCLPMFILVFKQWAENGKASQRLDELKEFSKSVWQEVLSCTTDERSFLERSRKLQDQIFECRKSNPLVFDWFYSLKQSSQQEEMSYSTDSLIAEYNAAKKEKTPK